MDAIMEDKAEDFAYDLRTLINNNMIECDDTEVVGTRVDHMEPLKPGIFEVKRSDGTAFIVSVIEI